MFFFRSHSNKGKLARFYGTEEWFSDFLVGFSYVASVFMTLITLIVEFASPKCVSYRPKFGVKGGSCFFNGKMFRNWKSNFHKDFIYLVEIITNIISYIERVAKGIWLFVPMAIALLINIGVFVTVILAIWKKKKAFETLNKGNSRIQAKSKKDDGFISQYVYNISSHQ